MNLLDVAAAVLRHQPIEYSPASNEDIRSHFGLSPPLLILTMRKLGTKTKPLSKQSDLSLSIPEKAESQQGYQTDLIHRN